MVQSKIYTIIMPKAQWEKVQENNSVVFKFIG